MDNRKYILLREDQIRQTLRQLGIIETYKGCRYLVDAVELAYQGVPIGHSMYAEIGDKHRAKAANVQQNIRTCIQRARQISPEFYTTLTGRPVEGRLTPVPAFISAVLVWTQLHSAVFVFDNKSVVGRVVCDEEAIRRRRSPFERRLKPLQK